MQVYESVFSRKCQKLMPPNPLFEAFRTALINNDSKTIKNLLECIKWLLFLFVNFYKFMKLNRNLLQ